MDDKKEEKKQATETNQWGTQDPELQDIIRRAKISPKKFDPNEIKK